MVQVSVGFWNIGNDMRIYRIPCFSQGLLILVGFFCASVFLFLGYIKFPWKALIKFTWETFV